jgi:phosphoribosyl-dephospho-CoA transferase
MGLRPHDLVRLSEPGAVLNADPVPPAGVTPALAMAPFAVVRRCGAAPPGMVPVGVRGRTRSERFAAQVPVAAIAGCLAPERLAVERAWEQARRRASVPALAALAAAAPWLDALGLPWGPVGGIGFELATGIPVLTAASDVDLLVRAAGPLDLGKLRALAARLATMPARFDVQLELDAGAVALAEVCREIRGTVLLRTARGPRLVAWPGP